MSFNSKPFKIQLKNGVIRSLSVDKSMTNDEMNQLKGILSQIQIDTKGQNVIKCKYNHLPSSNGVNAVYKTMEETVTGKCETSYELGPVPSYLANTQTSWVPMPHLNQHRSGNSGNAGNSGNNGNGNNGNNNGNNNNNNYGSGYNGNNEQYYEIVKTKNYSNCEQRMGYHFGINGMNEWKPNTNQMGDFFSVSKIFLLI